VRSGWDRAWRQAQAGVCRRRDRNVTRLRRVPARRRTTWRAAASSTARSIGGMERSIPPMPAGSRRRARAAPGRNRTSRRSSRSTVRLRAVSRPRTSLRCHASRRLSPGLRSPSIRCRIVAIVPASRRAGHRVSSMVSPVTRRAGSTVSSRAGSTVSSHLGHRASLACSQVSSHPGHRASSLPGHRVSSQGSRRPDISCRRRGNRAPRVSTRARRRVHRRARRPD